MAQKKLVKVKLGFVNEAIAVAKKAESEYQKTNTEAQKAIDTAKVALKLSNDTLKSMSQFMSLYEKLEDQFKELGLDLRTYSDIMTPYKNIKSKETGVLNLREALENFIR